MRRKDREVTDFSAMMEIMKHCDCCRLGLLDSDGVYLVPLNFGYRETSGQVVLYFHSAREGRKVSCLERQKIVSFEMDTGHRLIPGETACRFSYAYQCIMGKGTVERLDDPTEKAEGLQEILRRYTGRKFQDFDSGALSKVLVFRLTVEEWSCKEHIGS